MTKKTKTSKKSKPRPYSNLPIAEQYARAVLVGDVPACRLVKLACKRHLQDRVSAAKGKLRGLWFDEKAGDYAIGFFQFLRHSKGEWAGRPFRLGPWQQFILWCVFGWKRPDGTRRFRTVLVEIPRKNGKSTFGAGVGLLLLVADSEPGAEIYSAATMKEQARRVHGEAMRMVKSSPALYARIASFKDNLCIPRTNSKFVPLGADKDSMDGLNTHGLIFDELHAQKTRKMFDVLQTSMGARRQPLMFNITTAGYDRHSICWEEHDYAVKVLEGIFQDDEYFAYIATIDEGDDWRDPKVWAKVNPNLGVSVKLSYLQALCRKAQATPRAQNAFRRYHLDEWTEQSVRWMDMHKWDACNQLVDETALVGRECLAGLDMASSLDVAAFVMLFPPKEMNEKWKIIPRFWIPKDNIRQRVEGARVPYDLWEKQGLIKATPGNNTDYDAVRADIKELGEKYIIREVVADPYNAIQLMTQLQGDGFTVVSMRQSFNLSPGIKYLEGLVVGQKLAHGGNPIMRWMMNNTVVRSNPEGQFRPDKERSAEKIDGVAALVMAALRAIAREISGPSIYEERGVIAI